MRNEKSKLNESQKEDYTETAKDLEVIDYVRSRPGV